MEIVDSGREKSGLVFLCSFAFCLLACFFLWSGFFVDVFSLSLSLIAYYVAFGPHGPRAPTSAPGEGFKILLSTLGLIGLGGVLFLTVQSFGTSFEDPSSTLVRLQSVFYFILAAPPPKTLTKEWQEASNERAKELNLNPITGT